MKWQSRHFLFKEKLLFLLSISMSLLFVGISSIIYYFFHKTRLEIGLAGYETVSVQTENYLKEQVRERTKILETQLLHTESAALYVSNLIGKNPSKYNKLQIEHILKSIYVSLGNSSAKLYFYSSGTGLQVFPSINYLKKNSLHLQNDLPIYLPSDKEIKNSEKAVFWSRPHDSLLEENIDWVVDVFAPLNHDSPYQAFIGISISLTNLMTQFNQFQSSRGAYSFLLDSEQNLIAAQPHAKLELSSSEKYTPRGIISLTDLHNEKFEEALREMALGKSNVVNVNLKNNPKYFAFHPLNNLPWRLGVMIPEAYATVASVKFENIIQTSMKQSFVYMSIAALALLFVAIYIGGLFIGKLLIPLQQVSTASRSIAEGNFEKRVEVHSKDEIGNMAEFFNRMADQIQQLIVHLEKRAFELENFNKLLEEKVNERTEELLTSKKELEHLNQNLQLEVQERQAAENKLRYVNNTLEKLAKLDGLTGIPNRRFLDQKLEEEWNRLTREHKPISFILFDVDYFKLYNDHYGHQAGDSCLVEIAQACLGILKKPGDFIARYGGEEFAVVLPYADEEGAIKIVTDIQAEVSKREILHEKSMVSNRVTISFGISTQIPSPGSGPETLIRDADKALYTAKRNGRNQYSCHSLK